MDSDNKDLNDQLYRNFIERTEEISEGLIDEEEYEDFLSNRDELSFYLFGERHFGDACREVLIESLSKKEADLFFVEIDKEGYKDRKNYVESVKNHNWLITSFFVSLSNTTKSMFEDAWKNRESLLQGILVTLLTSLLYIVLLPLVLLSNLSHLKNCMKGQESAIIYSIKYSTSNGIDLECIDDKSTLYQDASIKDIPFLLIAMFLVPVYALVKSIRNNTRSSPLYTKDKSPFMVTFDTSSDVMKKAKAHERDKIMSKNIIEFLKNNNSKDYENIYIITGAAHLWNIKCNLKRAGINKNKINTPGISEEQ